MDSNSNNPLGPDNKLSPASAAMSLKHANARELPSFPSAGVANKQASAGAAASLAVANQKEFQHWKPEALPPANKAALLATDYKMDPLWHPEASAAGSKAAMLAARNPTKVEAAGAPRSKGSPSPSRGPRHKAHGAQNEGASHKALLAATGAVSGRQRSESMPVPKYTYPDATNSAANALKAAKKANWTSQSPALRPTDLPGLSQEEATRIHDQAVTNMSREMYTSNPPVAPEVDAKKREAGLHAAAVSMAKSMYGVQQKALESHAGGPSDSLRAATSVHHRRASSTATEENAPSAAMQFVNLQEAAQKLAAERLAKLQDEGAEYRSYYGTNNPPPRSRLSMLGRRRASSDGQLSEADEDRSRRIRNEMSMFKSNLAEVDAQKRKKDRDNLLAAARRNVTKNMEGLDEKVYAETGKATPKMQADWDSKAREKAESESKSRMANYGKVDIGAGKFMEPSEVEAIAASRVQPTLDQISKKAEEDRARDEEQRQAAEEARRIEFERERDNKERDKKTKEAWKQLKEEEKHDKQVKKHEEKTKQEEQKLFRGFDRNQEIQRQEQEAEEMRAVARRKAEEEKERKEKGKEEWKRFKEQEKEEQKAKKAEEKARKAQDQDNRKSKLGAPLSAMAATIGGNKKEKEAQAGDRSDDDDPGRAALKKTISPPLEAQALPASSQAETAPMQEDTTHRDTPPVATLTIAPTTSATADPVPEERPTSPREKDHGKVSSWLKSKFGSRSGHKLTKSEAGTIKPLRAADKPGPASEKPKISTEYHTSSVGEPSVAAADFATSSGPNGGSEALKPAAVLTEPPSDPVPVVASAMPTAPTDGASGTGTGAASSGVSPVSPAATDAASAREPFAESASAAATPTPARHPLAAATAAADSADRNSSERDVALAGRADAAGGPGSGPGPDPAATAPRPRSSTSISSLSSDVPAVAGGSGSGSAAEAPTPVAASDARGRAAAGAGPAEKRPSVAAESSAGDDFEEARDRFDEGALQPPSAAGLGTGRMDSPARETRFREEL